MDKLKNLTKAELMRIEEENAMDAHSCRLEADERGRCTWCGATLYGSPAYLEERGCDPVGCDT